VNSAHKNGIKKSNDLNCCLCPKSFSTKSKLTRHYYHHARQSSCQKCFKTFPTTHDLKIHDVAVHAKEKNHACGVCGRSFADKRNLVRHEITHKKTLGFSCSFCTKKFKRKEYLQKHQISHTKMKPFQCEICKVKFAYKSNMKRHFKKH